jgi:hypothetical protein
MLIVNFPIKIKEITMMKTWIKILWVWLK